MFKTLYKNTHRIAGALTAMLLVVTTAAAATFSWLTHEARQEPRVEVRQPAEPIPTIGRFVVTPDSVKFIPAPETPDATR